MNVVFLVGLSAIVLIVSNAFGRVLFRLTKVTEADDLPGLFISTVLGMLTLVGLYALISTAGVSVMWLALAGVGMILRSLHQEPAVVLTPDRPWRWGWLWLGAGAVMALVRLPLVLKGGSNHLGVPYYDFVYYARLIFPLNVLGIETPLLDPIYTHQLVQQPYHYTELWLNGLLVRVTGLPSVHTLYLSVYSALLGLAYIGYAALFRQVGHPRRWSALYAAVMIPLTGIAWPFFEKFFLLKSLYYDLSNFIFVFPKLAIIVVIMQLLFLLYLRGHLRAASWAMALLPIVYISTAPAVVLGGGLWAVYLAWRKKQTWRWFLAAITPLGLVLVGFGIFYFLTKQFHHTETIEVATRLDDMISKASTWRFAPTFLIGLGVALGAYYGLYLLVLVGLHNLRVQALWAAIRQREQLLVLAGLWYASAGFCWFLFRPFYEGWQFFNNVVLPLCPVLLTVLLADALLGRRLATRGIVVIALVMLAALNYTQLFRKIDINAINQHYDNRFMKQMLAQQPSLSKMGAFVLDTAAYNDPFAYNARNFMPGLYTNLLRNNLVMLSLSHIDLDSATVARRFPDRAASLQHWIGEAPINRFYYQQRPVHPTWTHADAQLAFVRRYGINFVCATPKAHLPASLQPLVRERLVDPLTGEQFFRLQL